MRIGIVIYGSLATVSGGYLYDRQLVQFLRANGHTVEIISLPWRNYVRHLADNGSSALFNQLQTAKLDLLLQDELNHPSLVRINQRLTRKGSYPIISIVHHLRVSENHPPTLKLLYRWVERHYLRSVDGFVYNSATTQQSVETLIQQAKPALVVYPSGSHIATPTFHELNQKLRTKSKQTPFRILFIGNLMERKGMHVLLMGLKKILTLAWHLDIVGSLEVDKAYSQQIRRQIVENGLQDRVILHGHVNDAQLREFLQQAHLLAVPSYEGFGIVYLEAMGNGLPVIGSTAGAAHEIIEQGITGFLVAPGDSAAIAEHVSTLAQNRSYWATMSQAARRRFDRHPTWEQSFSKLEEWIRNDGNFFSTLSRRKTDG